MSCQQDITGKCLCLQPKREEWVRRLEEIAERIAALATYGGWGKDEEDLKALAGEIRGDKDV